MREGRKGAPAEPWKPSEDLGLDLKCTRKPQNSLRPLYGGSDLIKNLALIALAGVAHSQSGHMPELRAKSPVGGA